MAGPKVPLEDDEEVVFANGVQKTKAGQYEANQQIYSMAGPIADQLPARNLQGKPENIEIVRKSASELNVYLPNKLKSRPNSAIQSRGGIRTNAL